MLVPPSRGTESEEPDKLTVDDRRLVAGVRANNRGVAVAFYDRARPIVDRTLVRLLGPRDHEYEDVAQAALFAIVEGISRFRGECPLNAWFSIVTARTAFLTVRRRRTERQIFAAGVEPADTDSVIGSHAGVVVARQAIDRVRKELQQMDPNQSCTFLLHDVYGYDLKEVSQITGVSLAAAQSRLVRGRRGIHERIRNNEELARLFLEV